MVRRGFTDIAEGQVHWRAAGEGGVPMVLLHPSPYSSLVLEGLLAELGRDRLALAPDTLGNGDSCPPVPEVPDIAYFADATCRLLDAMGIARADFYGAHTGARIATEIALTRPDRVRKLVLDGFGLYTPEDLDEILRVYAPKVMPDLHAGHLMWTWHFVRDQHLFFPWFKRDVAHRYNRDMPDAARLHALFMEVAKAVTTYHKSYRAAFRYSMADAVPKLTVPTLIAFTRSDMVFPLLDRAHALLPSAQRAELPGIEAPAECTETAAILRAFLDG
ncbi:alpha/beta fold hydrolase [Falsiroseomonas sp. HW251]|uniref:alpha/beta fold hydrolase n=1 Tax=Falsiroseomonas sp. HW251 TaxID=3390998 RepID=UPI003D31FB8D